MKKKILLARKSEKGQGFVELGLSLVFLLILLAVVIDLGWAFFTLIALRDAAQEAASVGAICPIEPSKIEARLRSAATSPIDLSDLDFDPSTDICVFDPSVTPIDCLDPATDTIEVGYSVNVTVTYQHEIMVPLIGAFINSQSYPLTANAVDTILATDCRIAD